MFELTRDEYHSLRSQFVTLDSTGRGKYSKYSPFADYNDINEDTRMQLELNLTNPAFLYCFSIKSC